MTIEELDNRVTKLEEQHDKDHDRIMQDRYELRELLNEVVSSHNKEIIEKIKELEVNYNKRFDELQYRITELENEKAKTALKQKQYILGTVAGFVLLALLNNVSYIIKSLFG